MVVQAVPWLFCVPRAQAVRLFYKLCVTMSRLEALGPTVGLGMGE